jgi:membrane protease YdiL (CAAX protease family)
MLPAVMPLAMRSVFRATTTRFGERRGYQAGFGVYWLTCWTAAAAIAGPRRLARTFRRSQRSLRTPRTLSVAVLAFPAVGAVITEFLPNVRRAGPAATATSIGIGLTNAAAEEAFWRALPVAMFPDDPVRGWLWPAAGFTAWHLVPLRAAGADPGRTAKLLLGAGFIGLGYGWVAFQTRSVASVLGPHAITDASGVRAVKAMWSRRD